MHFHRWLWALSGLASLGATKSVVVNSLATVDKFGAENVQKLTSPGQKFCIDNSYSEKQEEIIQVRKKIQLLTFQEIKGIEDFVWLPRGDWCNEEVTDEDLVLSFCNKKESSIRRLPRSAILQKKQKKSIKKLIKQKPLCLKSGLELKKERIQDSNISS